MYSLENVFDMALQLERNGHQFYRRAAEFSTNPAAKTLLTELAEWELRHEKLFAEMKATSGAPAETDQAAEAAEFIQAVVEGKIFKHRDESMARLTGESTFAEIIEMAIEMETSAMLLFTGLRQMIAGGAGGGAESIDQVIQEEMGHVRILSRQAPLT